MNDTFVCKACRRVVKKNPRIKTGQKYCGSKSCQQQRKNLWEKHKLLNDRDYQQRRKRQKQGWYKTWPGHQYQAEYRIAHPKNNASPKKSQNKQNQRACKKALQIKISEEQIDTHSGLFRLIPYTNVSDSKIVKTDALIVRISCLPSP